MHLLLGFFAGLFAVSVAETAGCDRLSPAGRAERK